MTLMEPPTWTEPTPPQRIGMKMTLAPDATAEDAIATFRERAAEQGFTWVEGSERADRAEYVTAEREHLVAGDVRGFLFPTVYRWDKTTRSEVTGSVWTVGADAAP